MENKKEMNPKVILGIAMFFLFFLSAGITYGLLDKNYGITVDESQAEDLDERANDAAILKKDRINVLLLALDARPGEDEEARTDSIIFASIDRNEKIVSIMSIPRDTRVQLKGHGQDKINNAHVYGGVELVQKTVEDLLGVTIDYHVKTNFEGFRDIIDTLGGVEIDVERRMYYYQGDPYDRIDLQKGFQRLNGDKALQYVRFRSDALGDISRTQRQQNFLQALAKEMMQMNTLWKIPTLIPQISKAIETNMGLSDMLALALTAKDWQTVEIVSHTLPGNFLDLNGISYWQVDPAVAKRATRDLLNGEVNTSVVEGRTIVLNDRPVKITTTEDNAMVVDEEDKIEEKDNNRDIDLKPTAPTSPNKPTRPTVPMQPDSSQTKEPKEPIEPKKEEKSTQKEDPTISVPIIDRAPAVPSGVEPLYPATPTDHSIQYHSGIDENI
ncbi:LCP family protein [Heliorestis convoluta]|uniref:Cell envelope-related transcriptional attenuator n=1 Tax=Heliorestis convoluta TaxID=356322 RepID=A0A5Q2N301_9FIRM|nr:LCP family protein [Heliorestis convoluta]QGG48253.1 Cell envelope-related transcriptional attenuator [Heliorestis convoluta]